MIASGFLILIKENESSIYIYHNDAYKTASERGKHEKAHHSCLHE